MARSFAQKYVVKHDPAHTHIFQGHKERVQNSNDHGDLIPLCIVLSKAGLKSTRRTFFPLGMGLLTHTRRLSTPVQISLFAFSLPLLFSLASSPSFLTITPPSSPTSSPLSPFFTLILFLHSTSRSPSIHLHLDHRLSTTTPFLSTQSTIFISKSSLLQLAAARKWASLICSASQQTSKRQSFLASPMQMPTPSLTLQGETSPCPCEIQRQPHLIIRRHLGSCILHRQRKHGAFSTVI